MCHVHSTYIPINCKWVALLVGLHMKVPDDWWLSFSYQTLNAGMIAGINFDINTNIHFQLELDKEWCIYYAMCYDAVVCYVNEMHSSSSFFHLPAYALRNPLEDVMEVETVDDGNYDDNDDDDYITHTPSMQQKTLFK